MKPTLCGQESSRRAPEISIVFSPECELWVNTVELHSLKKALQVNWMPELPRLQSVLPCACFNNRETPWRMLLLSPLEWAVGIIRELGWRSLWFWISYVFVAIVTSHYQRKALSGPRGAAPCGRHLEAVYPWWRALGSAGIWLGPLWLPRNLLRCIAPWSEWLKNPEPSSLDIHPTSLWHLPGAPAGQRGL